MNEENKTQSISGDLLVFRKACRVIAGTCLAFAVIFVIAWIIDIFIDSESINVSIFGVLAICIPAYIFWKIPDWIIKIYKKHFIDALNDPSKEVHVIKTGTDSNAIEYMEVTNKDSHESREKYLTEDMRGNIIFDSTSRKIRVIFGGAFLIIGIIIGKLIYSFSDGFGLFEYFFLGGWILFCLVSIGYTYEVTINKNLGTADRKAGWFIFTVRRRFNLADFSQVVVGSRFYRDRYDSASDRFRSSDPKFSVYLAGNKFLSLKVFSSLIDARQMGEKVSAYLKLPLEGKNDMVL